jgi:Rap guanine nucleotide exchange factor 4
MSGTPQKMLDHLLETRLTTQVVVGPTDPFLDDFLLTHIVFMPVTLLVDELANHFHCDSEEDPEDQEYILTCKKRVIQFVQRWVLAVRHAVFEDPVAAEFIEVSSLFDRSEMVYIEIYEFSGVKNPFHTHTYTFIV